MPVIVDAMGGDHAPDEIVVGAVAAAREFEIDVVLVGNKDQLEAMDISSPRVTIEHAETVIGMNEHPAKALRRKPDSSIAISARLAKEPGSALLSAGHTGAVMAATLFTWGRIPGIERPGIACVIPTKERSVVVLDVGANVDCKPTHLVQFGIMGAAYAEKVLKAGSPTVGLLNIGEEEKKGNELTLATFKELASCGDIEFAGNVEPSGLFAGQTDVVVTDGYAGNIFLKSSEAVSNLLFTLLKSELSEQKLDGQTIGALFGRIGQYSTRNPKFAGAPLLGVNGTCIIAHGGARAETIKHCVNLANRFARSETLQSIKDNVAR